MHPEPQIAKNVIEMWMNDFKSISNRGEVIKIVSGEAFCDLYRALEEHFRKAVDDYGAVFKMIAGPIISIERETGSNAVLELADENLLDLYIAPFRQLTHFRVFDWNFVFREDYHGALDKNRSGIYKRDYISISKFSYDFDNTIRALKLEKHNESSNLLKAYKNDIRAIKEKFGENYDFINRSKFEEVGASINTAS